MVNLSHPNFMTTRSTKWTYPTPRPEVLAKQKVVMMRMATDGLMVSLLGSTEYRLCQDGDFYMLLLIGVS